MMNSIQNVQNLHIKFLKGPGNIFEWHCGLYADGGSLHVFTVPCTCFVMDSTFLSTSFLLGTHARNFRLLPLIVLWFSCIILKLGAKFEKKICHLDFFPMANTFFSEIIWPKECLCQILCILLVLVCFTWPIRAIRISKKFLRLKITQNHRHV